MHVICIVYVVMYVICIYVYCTCYAPMCHANGMEKASFARIVGANEVIVGGKRLKPMYFIVYVWSLIL